MQQLEILGASEHNLKNIDINIPKNKLVVITGVSGSGKSSLAFDTIYAEGQRRYLESFSSYARQFLGSMERPKVDSIKGLSPVISIEQKTVSKNPRSTVGTITEIYDFLRLLFAKVATAYSFHTGLPMKKMSEQEIENQIFKDFKNQSVLILAPLVRGRKGHYRELFEEHRMKGFVKIRVDGKIEDIKPNRKLDRYKIHNIELVYDHTTLEEENKMRAQKAILESLKIGNGLIFIMPEGNPINIKQYSQHFFCPESGLSYEDPNPNTFSFNTPFGYCPDCQGLGYRVEPDVERIIPFPDLSIAEGGFAPIGKKREAGVYQEFEAFAKKLKISSQTPVKNIAPEILKQILYGTEEKKNKQKIFEFNYGLFSLLEKSYYYSGEGWWKQWAEEYMNEEPCKSCNATRLKKESLSFKIKNTDIATLSRKDIQSFCEWFDNIENEFSEKENIIAKDVLKEIRTRTKFLLDVGLHYINLHLSSKNLSGGEAQRIRLATQIGSQLQGITYILDEPSIGLHQRDNLKLINSLKHLRDIGNTVIVVEHDKEIMLAADYIIDIGPGAGKKGGVVVAQGSPKEFIKQNTITAQYLNNEIVIPLNRTKIDKECNYIILKGAKGNNLKNVELRIPLKKFIAVTGVSGSGKSTLILETLYPILYQTYNQIKKVALPYQSIEGLEHINKVIEIDQAPIGRTPRSNAATYCGFFTEIRDLYASLTESKVRGYKVGRFSFNVKGGRCESCQGGGYKNIEMGFLPDVYVLCSACNGKRYNKETIDIRYKGKSIYDVLEMTVDEAVVFFEAFPVLGRKIKTLQDVGLGYISLGQSAVTFSGGEAQRIKLATELSKRDTGKTFYILDEPTTGLHFKDVHVLINLLKKLVEKGNTVLFIEHNLDMIKSADYIIDIGPEGGNAGGQIIAQGAPIEFIQNTQNQSAKYLALEFNTYEQ